MQLAHKLSVLVFAAFALAACGTTSGGRSGVPDVIVPRPEPVTLYDTNVMVVNRDNIDEFNALVQSGQIMVTMPLEEFNRMVENGQAIAVYMANQNIVIDTYEDRIENTEQ